jgi:putative DNA primase/helicase
MNAPANDILPIPYSEDAVALEFTARHGPEWRYVAKWNRWLYWTGTHWAEDDRLKVFDLIRNLCREIAVAELDPTSNAAPKKIMHKTVGGVHGLARADPHHAAAVDQWDRKPHLLGTKSRTNDLNSGLDIDPDPLHYITKRVAADPGGECPNWLAFLDRVTNGDRDLQSYLQRAVGYCLTGLISEHVIFFLYGLGANGKSVFVNTISGVLGDYAVTAPTEMFVASKNERHPTELARLQGARFVTATETETGQQWAEAKIKALTGGDKIVGRFMRRDFFEFTPQFKLMVAGNHKPALRSVDEAMRRRIHLVPFTVTIPAEERDPNLTEELKTEWPGILQWAIRGCLAWRPRLPRMAKAGTQSTPVRPRCHNGISERRRRAFTLDRRVVRCRTEPLGCPARSLQFMEALRQRGRRGRWH